MKKTLIIFALVCCMLAIILPISTVSAASVTAFGTCGDNLTWTLYDDGELVISGSGAMNNWSSSSSNRAPWYDYRSSIKTVNIKKGVTSIGNYAFSNCTSLTSIDLPDGVTSIGGSAFSECQSLTSIDIPDSVTSIGDWAFYSCDSLTSIDLPDGVTRIGHNAFWLCDSLTSIDLPDSLTSIGVRAFYSCTSLASIEVADDNAYYCDIDGVLFNKDKTMLVCYPAGKTATSYVIPNGVTSIGDYAFYNCTSLRSIDLPAGLTSIGEDAFENCKSLKSIDIPDGLTSIRFRTFYECTSLTSVEIPDSVTSIEFEAFCFCDSLSSVDLPDSVTLIASRAFFSCDSLRSIDIPDSVTSIGDCAFAVCTSLTSIDLPDSVTSIGDEAFYACDSLTKAVVNNPNARFGSFIFSRVSSRFELHGYKGSTAEAYASEKGHKFVPIIRYYTVTFKNYDGSVISSVKYKEGTSVVLPATPKKAADNIYSYTFSGWDKEVVAVNGDAEYTAVFTPVYIDYTVVFKNYNGDVLSAVAYHYGDTVTLPAAPSREADNTYTYTFSGWDKEVVKVTGNAEYVAEYTAEYIEYTVVFKKYNGKVISTATYHYGDTVIVPADPTRPADETFSYIFKGWDKKVAEVTGNVEYTAQYVSVYIDYAIVFKDYNGKVIYSDTYHYGEAVDIPADPTRAADDTYTYEFAGWDKEITTVTGDIEYIAQYTAQRKITASGTCGNNLTWKLYSGGELVISGSGDMTNWSFYTSVPWYNYQSSIKTVIIEDGVTSIGDYAFYKCESLTSVDLPDGVTSIGNYVFAYCNSLTSIDLPDSVTSIGDFAFSNSTKLTTIDIPDSVTSIGEWAFAGCTSLTSIELPDSVTSIGDDAFYWCTSLTSIDIPDSVTSFGEYAFYKCESLTSIDLPDGLTSIGDYAFWGCDSLTSIDLPDSVTSIGGRAFYWCTSLTSIDFPDSVTSIGGRAFYNCTSLTKAVVNNPNVWFSSDVFYGVSSRFELHGYAGSTAETYASENRHTFVAIETKPAFVVGDANGDDLVTKDDAIYILMYTFFENEYPAKQSLDFNKDGNVTKDDAIYVLMYTFFPDDYPIG